MQNLILFIILNILILFGLAAASDKKNWIYELTDVSTKTSNADLVNISLGIERISRGVYSLSGYFYLNIDIAEGDQNEIELNSFRSANNDGDFKTIPLQMSRRHFYDAFNSHYKDVLMETFKDCSNLPYFEDEIPVPIEKKTYELTRCQFSQDGMPNHLETGTYRIVVSGYGEVEWEILVMVEVEPFIG